jgi:hypothetical protein
MFCKEKKIWAYQSRPALAGVQAGFSRFGLFRENWIGRLFATLAGFSRIGHFRVSSSSLVAEIGHKNDRAKVSDLLMRS